MDSNTNAKKIAQLLLVWRLGENNKRTNYLAFTMTRNLRNLKKYNCLKCDCDPRTNKTEYMVVMQYFLVGYRESHA